MTLKNDRELEVTREKLKMLEDRLETSRQETYENPHVRELSQRSIKRLINQLKEEIARYNSSKTAPDDVSGIWLHNALRDRASSYCYSSNSRPAS